jgi:acyl dehydratase
MNVPGKYRDKDGVDVYGTGIYWDDVSVGYRYRTLGRTVTEADITFFIGATGIVEEMFTNLEYVKTASQLGGRPVPGTLVFCFAEGLLMQSTVQRTGMAFMEADLRILKPTSAGDTIHVDCEVVEARATSKPGRGLMRTFNQIINQRGEVVATYNPLRMVRSRPK